MIHLNFNEQMHIHIAYKFTVLLTRHVSVQLVPSSGDYSYFHP
jgi:hypothetical protein